MRDICGRVQKISCYSALTMLMSTTATARLELKAFNLYVNTWICVSDVCTVYSVHSIAYVILIERERILNRLTHKVKIGWSAAIH